MQAVFCKLHSCVMLMGLHMVVSMWMGLRMVVSRWMGLHMVVSRRMVPTRRFMVVLCSSV